MQPPPCTTRCTSPVAVSGNEKPEFLECSCDRLFQHPVLSWQMAADAILGWLARLKPEA